MMHRINRYHNQIRIVAELRPSLLVKSGFRSCKGIDCINVYRIWQRRRLALHSIRIEYMRIIIHMHSIARATRAHKYEQENSEQAQEASSKPSRRGFHLSIYHCTFPSLYCDHTLIASITIPSYYVYVQYP